MHHPTFRKNGFRKHLLLSKFISSDGCTKDYFTNHKYSLELFNPCLNKQFKYFFCLSRYFFLSENKPVKPEGGQGGRYLLRGHFVIHQRKL